jgi:uncharacterized membrane protein YbhN (UPF0104 family)
MSKGKRPWRSLALSVGISAVLLYFLSSTVNYQEVYENLSKIGSSTAVLAVCCVWLMVLMNSLRYCKMLERLNGKKVSVTTVFRINIATIFFAHLTPLNAVADGIRAVILWRRLNIPLNEILKSVAQERLSMVFYCLVAMIICLPVQNHYGVAQPQLLFQIFLILSSLIVLYSVIRFLRVLHVVEGRIKKILRWFGYALEYCSLESKNWQHLLLVIFQLFAYSIILWALALDMDVSIPLELWFAIVPITYLMQNLPVSYLGWGIREFILVTGLQGTGYASDATIMAISVAAGLIVLIASIPGALAIFPEVRKY